MVKRFKETFKDDKGFFTLMNIKDSSLIQSLFGEEITGDDIEDLDDYITFCLGDYILFSNGYTEQKLVNFCILRNKKSWLSYKDTLDIEYKLNGKTFTETRVLDINSYDNTNLVTQDKETIEHNENTDKQIDLQNEALNTQKKNKLLDLIFSDVIETILMGV